MSLSGPVSCDKTKITGEISFELRVPEETEVLERSVSHVGHVTRAAPVECPYQYPEAAQINALLSIMMNQLTKIAVRVSKELRAWRVVGDKRFTVVAAQTSSFFDSIYYNMTNEYRRFVNQTESRLASDADDPCRHQTEIRDLWRVLLDSSQESLRRAALACLEEYLRLPPGGGAPGRLGGRLGRLGRRGRARSRAAQLLRDELARARLDRLHMLCDDFQLCFNELL